MSAVRAGETPGLWLRRQRIAAGLTQEDLAERSGVSLRAIADLERGRTHRPYPSSVRALVGALGLPETAAMELVARYRAAGDPTSAPAQGTTETTGTTESAAPEARPANHATVPRQLPTAVPYFAGRASELTVLDQMLDDARQAAAGVVISAIGGTAGVGKTGDGPGRMTRRPLRGGRVSGGRGLGGGHADGPTGYRLPC